MLKKFKGCGRNEYGSLLFFVGYTEGKGAAPPFCHESKQGGDVILRVCIIHESELIVSAGIFLGKC
jgi:hypothetical protein